MSSQHENTNSKGDFVLKARFKVRFKDFKYTIYKDKSESKISINLSILGYSTPNTLTDKSSMIRRGQKGDATILQPSLLFCVPLILDRYKKKLDTPVSV